MDSDGEHHHAASRARYRDPREHPKRHQDNQLNPTADLNLQYANCRSWKCHLTNRIYEPVTHSSVDGDVS